MMNFINIDLINTWKMEHIKTVYTVSENPVPTCNQTKCLPFTSTIQIMLFSKIADNCTACHWKDVQA